VADLGLREDVSSGDGGRAKGLLGGFERSGCAGGSDFDCTDERSIGSDFAIQSLSGDLAGTGGGGGLDFTRGCR
jgi:hypothetical protein